MVAQDQEVVVAEVALQARLLVVADRDALVVVIAERRQGDGRLLRDRQQALALGRDRDAARRVRVQHAQHVVPRRVDRAVDHEPGRVDRVRALGSLLPAASTRTRLDAVISSKSIPYGLIRNPASPGQLHAKCA